MHLFIEHTTNGIVGTTTKKSVRIVCTDVCAERTSCTVGCGSCGGKKPHRTVLVERDDATRFHPGERVTVRYVTIHETAGALLVFGFPLLCASAALFLWHTQSPGTVESGASLLTAFGAFIAGFAVVRLADRSFHRRFPATIIAPAAPPVTGDAPHG